MTITERTMRCGYSTPPRKTRVVRTPGFSTPPRPLRVAAPPGLATPPRTVRRAGTPGFAGGRHNVLVWLLPATLNPGQTPGGYTTSPRLLRRDEFLPCFREEW